MSIIAYIGRIVQSKEKEALYSRVHISCDPSGEVVVLPTSLLEGVSACPPVLVVAILVCGCGS